MRPIDADKINFKWVNGIICVEPKDIKKMPTVDAEPIRHGKWIRDEFGTRCSACGLYAYRDKFDQPWEPPYCPNCGAKMERKEE